MDKLSKGLKSAVLIAFLALYLILIWADATRAAPAGASLTYISTDYGPNGSSGSRTDPGGTIVTLNLNAVQQDSGWKAYIGNITGRLVLRNAYSQSIYEWALADSALTGSIFITRAATVNWTPLRCANDSEIVVEDGVMGFLSSTSDSINRTFSNQIHKSMTISEIGTIGNGSCRSTATWVNNTAQALDESSLFQEILLSDTSTLVYATFIDQDAIGFDYNETNNKTHDFQVIVADAKNITDYTYYFYADIS